MEIPCRVSFFYSQGDGIHGSVYDFDSLLGDDFYWLWGRHGQGQKPQSGSRGNQHFAASQKGWGKGEQGKSSRAQGTLSFYQVKRGFLLTCSTVLSASTGGLVTKTRPLFFRLLPQFYFVNSVDPPFRCGFLRCEGRRFCP